MTSDDSDGSHGLGDNPQGRTLLVVVNPLAPLDNSNNSSQGEADSSNIPQAQHAVMLQGDSSPHDANACGQQPAPTSPPAALDVEAGQGLCWICLDEDADGEVTKPCSCPDRWSHPLCLARWQLRQHGKEDETTCRFCKSALPPWPEALADYRRKSAAAGLEPIKRRAMCIMIACITLAVLVVVLVMTLYWMRMQRRI